MGETDGRRASSQPQTVVLILCCGGQRTSDPTIDNDWGKGRVVDPRAPLNCWLSSSGLPLSSLPLEGLAYGSREGIRRVE